MSNEKEYTNGEVTVVWRSDKCAHTGICLRGLRSVFDLKARPWIDMQGANTDEIVAQVCSCPSGALTYYENGKEKGHPYQNEQPAEVKLIRNGPIAIMQKVRLTDEQGNVTETETNTCFCRCGRSGNLPYCDGTHLKPAE